MAAEKLGSYTEMVYRRLVKILRKKIASFGKDNEIDKVEKGE